MKNGMRVSRRPHQGLNLVLAFALLMPLLSAPSTPAQVARVHPALLQLAAQQPTAKVSVIVQKLSRDARVESVVARLGGVITKDLSLINAFVADLTAQAALELAQANGVKWVSPDAPVESTSAAADTAVVTNTYLDTLGARRVWRMGFQGQGIGVAVLDSGIAKDSDFSAKADKGSGTRIVKRVVTVQSGPAVKDDLTGHGTHVAGIIGGNGYDSRGVYQGIAPQVNLISVQIAQKNGTARESDAVEAMNWVLQNRAKYNIRVVNLSFNAMVEQSYHVSPLDAAAEILWFNRIVVIAAVGNRAAGQTVNPANAAPANDPFIITVGASDERGTANPSDDVVAAYSAFGQTLDGFSKPDIIAPGTNIISVLSTDSAWGSQYPARVVSPKQYIRLSGTSMATPMVTGAVALMLQRQPGLTPDQVKYRLLHASNPISGPSKLYPYLNVYAAVTGATTQSANTGLPLSRLLGTGADSVAWSSVNWNSVNWNSVNWNSVNWNSVNWNSVNWNNVNWD
jgi:serine protease AprX